MSSSLQLSSPIRRVRLSEDLQALAGLAREDNLTLGGLMARLEGRAYTLLLVLLAIPFCQPIALPGLSTPFGVVIALFGLRFAFRQKPWLPARLLSTPIPSKFLPSVLQASAKLLGWVERFLHPRLARVFNYRATQFLAGVTIFFCGLLLLLPLPIPFSNLFPALTVVLMASSVAERDGFMLFAGWGVFALTLAFFAGIAIGGVEAVDYLKESFHGFFEPTDEAPGILPKP